MASKLIPLAFSVLFVAACGSSNSGKSENNCNQGTAPQAGNMQGIRVPSAPSTPGTSAPGTPTNPSLGQDAPANTCAPTQPGNLGETPTAPGVPNLPNAPQQPTAPNAGNPRTPAPALNIGNINGRWELSSDFCEDGTMSPDMQKLFQMMLNGDFNQSMTIKDSTVDEYSWVRFEIDPDTNNTMMCTLMRKSTLTRTGNEFRISRPAASFEDAGGLTPCNLQPVAAQTSDNLRISAQGGVLVVEIPSSKECNGKSRIQFYNGRNVN